VTAPAQTLRLSDVAVSWAQLQSMALFGYVGEQAALSASLSSSRLPASRDRAAEAHDSPNRLMPCPKEHQQKNISKIENISKISAGTRM